MSTLSLLDLAGQINSEHAAAVRAATTAVDHARCCGDLLLQAKAEIGHGGFLAWLADHCHVGERQARRYMRLASHWKAIESKTDSASDLTIKGALRLVSEEPSVLDMASAMVAELESIARQMSTKGVGMLADEIFEEQRALLGDDDLAGLYAASRREVARRLAALSYRADRIEECIGYMVEACARRVEELLLGAFDNSRCAPPNSM